MKIGRVIINHLLKPCRVGYQCYPQGLLTFSVRKDKAREDEQNSLLKYLFRGNNPPNFFSYFCPWPTHPIYGTIYLYTN